MIQSLKCQQKKKKNKMKIYDPKTSKGVLSGIRLTEESMEKINAKVKEFFIFGK